MGSHPHRLLKGIVGGQPMLRILMVALQTLISGDAEQGGSDGSPGPFGQGHGGEGVAVPGSGHEVRCGCEYCSRSAATLEAVGVKFLQSTEQTVCVIMQTFGILHFGVQEFAGVDCQADGIVGVTVRAAAELSKAGTLISTVADVGGGKGSVLFGSPAGRLSGAGVGGDLRQGGDAFGNFFALVEQAALITLKVAQTKVLHILQLLFEELKGESVVGGEGHCLCLN